MVMKPWIFHTWKEQLQSLQTSGNGFWDNKSSVVTDETVTAKIWNKKQWCHQGKSLT